MRLLFYGFLGLLCLLLAGISFVLVLGPSDLLREQLTDTIKLHTGREIAVNGPSSFTLYPRFGIALDDVTLSDPSDMGGGAFASVARLEIAMPLAGLLRRQLTVDRLLLKGAVVDLRVDAGGRANWRFERRALVPSEGKRAASTGLVRLASAEGSAELLRLPMLADVVGTGERQTAVALPPLPFQEIRIVDGSVRYRNDISGRREEVVGVQLRGKLAPDGRKLDIGGDGKWREESVQLQVAVASLPALLDGASPTGLKIASRHGEVLFEGSVAVAPLQQVAGKIRSSTPSLRAAAGWIGASLPPGAAIDSLNMTGALSVSAEQISLRDIAATADGSQVRGELTLTTAGSMAGRPLLRGALSLDKLDLNAAFRLQPSRSRSENSERRTQGQQGDAGAIDSGGQQPAASGTPAANAEVPKEAPRPQQVRGWSSQPFDLGLLRLGDADLKLDIGRIVYRNMLLEQSKVSATVHSGLLKAVIQETRLYRGRASGTLDIDASVPVPKVALQATIEGAEALELLKAAADFDRVAGRGAITLAVGGFGLTQQQLTDTATGTAAFNVANGAMIGFDISGVMRQVQRGQMPNLAISASDKTDFSDLSGSFVISGGVAQSQDLKLVSPALRVAGAGQFDLGRRQMDLRLKPKLTAPVPAAGAGGIAAIGAALANLDVPILIRGPWDQPRLSVDLDGVAKDNRQLKKGVEQIGEVLRSKEGKEAVKEIGKTLRNLFGK